MCGIFGVLFRDDRLPEEQRLRASAGLLRHRGPDGAGVHAAPGIGLAQTRLSMVDLDERSDQPFWDAERRCCVVYNGEIYNFRELRAELEQRGAVFRTTSDTEVLLQALMMDGADRTLPRLRGMFAFAFYDARSRRLLLARDRFGIKPLMLYQDADRLLFASEVKAMQPWIRLRPNGFHLIRFLMNYGVPVSNSSFFEDVDFVPAGTVIEVEQGGTPTARRFYELPAMADRERAAELESLGREQIVDLVDEQLQDAVEQMLFADARVGALCSGGVDSSLLMAMAARKHGDLAIFHANVVGPNSEYDAARRLAEHLKLDLLAVEAHDQDFIERTPLTLHHYEQPFYGHPHSVPFMMVAELVRANGVKAVLTGEGSDECFLGYEYLALEPWWAFYRRQVDRLGGLVRRVPIFGSELWPSASKTPRLIADMLGHFELSRDRRRIRRLYEERMGRPADLNVRTLDMLAYHLRTLLHRNDTMGMAASIEARFPFLDETLVETAINLPVRHKIRFSPLTWEKYHPFLRDKWVIRAVADRYLPKVLSQRKKQGFFVSAFRRMRIGREFFRSAFITDYFKLSREEFDLLYDSSDNVLVGRMMMLEAWGRQFIEGVALTQVRDDLIRHASI